MGAENLLRLLDGLAVDLLNPVSSLSDVFLLAREAHLTIYDATYLAFARQLNLPLATLDRQLADAAAAAGVALFAPSAS